MDDVYPNDTEPNFVPKQGDGKFKEVGLARGVAFTTARATVSAMGATRTTIDNDGLWIFL